MSANEHPRLPPARATLYPRRCFPPPRRPLAALNDRLLAHIVAKLAPPARPRLRMRPPAGAPRPSSRWRHGPTLREATRGWNELLGIWRQCDEPLCRRGRRCGGDPLICLPRYLPLLPHSIRVWFACVGVATEKNVSFTEALALAEREGEQAACARWHAAVRCALKAGGTPENGMNDL